MSKFHAIEMADEVAKHPHITYSKGLFGKFGQVVYSPTSSKMESYSNYYNEAVARQFQTLINSNDENLSQSLKPLLNTKCEDSTNFRLDLCISHDSRFIAMQLNHVADGTITHITPVRYFEGDEAQMVDDIFE